MSADALGEVGHFLRFSGGQIALAIHRPQAEPVLELLSTDTEWQMGGREPARIARWSAGLPRPELRDLRDVRGPVVDVRVENRTEHAVLPHVRVEVVQQLEEAVVPAQPFVKRVAHVAKLLPLRGCLQPQRALTAINDCLTLGEFRAAENSPHFAQGGIRLGETPRGEVEHREVHAVDRGIAK